MGISWSTAGGGTSRRIGARRAILWPAVPRREGRGGENRGRFMVEPLPRGFGYAFGHSLRRVLLSSLEGAAISAVKIAGVEHEFSTVPHVKEDVTDIILN